jgi:hypothetical protein
MIFFLGTKLKNFNPGAGANQGLIYPQTGI